MVPAEYNDSIEQLPRHLEYYPELIGSLAHIASDGQRVGVRGLGDGRQKLLFLPEAHTDFVSAIVGEEFGFLGVAALCLAFVWVVLRGLRAAWRTHDEYAGYLAAGMTLARRETFIIDPAGNIAKHYEKVDPATHSTDVLTDLEALATAN